MADTMNWSWVGLLALGAFHGINPGMGWLFAVALGMQTGNARGVWRALPPIALGHALAVGAVLAVASLAQLLIPLATLKIVVAASLSTFGVYRLRRHRHPRFGGMRVGVRDLTLWSFLMASAHGAGLMLLPFILAMPADVLASDHSHAHHLSASSTIPLLAVIAVGIHTVAYLATTALAALVVYRKVGLRLLRTAWFNLDWLWAGALMATGVLVLLT